MSRRFTAQFNPRISKDSDQIIEPVNDPNAYRKSVREFAARQIQIVRAKQKSSQFLQLNSFGRVEGGMGGFGEPLRNKGYYGTEPPLSYSFNLRPKFNFFLYLFFNFIQKIHNIMNIINFLSYFFIFTF